MSRILVLCPTRERPANAVRLKKAFDETADPATTLVFLVDNDDPRLNEYKNAKLPIIVDHPRRLGPWLNVASKKFIDLAETDPLFNPHYDIIGFVGDDVMPQTFHWDHAVRKAMKPNGIVYCDDGWQGENLPTSVFMDTDLIEAIGYMVYPELVHLYIDNHWKSLGEALGSLVYLPDVKLEHLHPFAGKAKGDAVYERANTGELYKSDHEAFAKFVQKELPKIVALVNG